jgi:hypothetical protein
MHIAGIVRNNRVSWRLRMGEKFANPSGDIGSWEHRRLGSEWSPVNGEDTPGPWKARTVQGNRLQ